MKKIIALVVCVLLVVAVFAACSAEEATAEVEEAVEEATAEVEDAAEETSEATTGTADAAEGGRIFFTNAFYTAPYCGPLNQSITDTAAKYGYEVTIVDGEGDGAVQLDQIETAISEKYDAILYFPADGASSINIVKRLVESGIPFINNNSMVDESVQDQVHYVGIDAYAQGCTAAEMAMELFPDGCNVVIVQGAGGSGPEVGRTNGFLDTINDNVKVLAMQTADWDPAKALSVTQDFISKYGDQIDVIYTEDDGMYEGAYQAAADAGVADKYKFISVSGNSVGIQAIRDGHLYCTVAHSPVAEGVLTIETLMKMLNGEEVEAKTILESVPVTIDNVEDPEFADPGW